MTRARPTLKDIAEATGFSANTVSLALRASPRLPEATRAAILAQAERLGYRPNHIARSLASRATRTIGLVLTDLMNPTLTLSARTIERELARAGYAMMFAASDSNLATERRAVELFLSYRVDGMLVYPARRYEIDHFKAAAQATPVLLLVDVPGSGLDTVTIDDRAGAQRAIAHLIARGHRRFAMFDGGRRLGNLDKMEGALRAVRQAGLPDDCISVFEPAASGAPHSHALMERAMALSPRPTALFTTTDALAAGALRWCRERGLAVPRELAVVGYDNSEIAEYGAVPLTTVNYAADEISRIGVARILDRIHKAPAAPAPETRLIEPHLIVRETS